VNITANELDPSFSKSIYRFFDYIQFSHFFSPNISFIKTNMMDRIMSATTITSPDENGSSIDPQIDPGAVHETCHIEQSLRSFLPASAWSPWSREINSRLGAE
jgi:hypothetical protein